nr:hypothetical protein [uncultured Tolumonas sp.]
MEILAQKPFDYAVVADGNNAFIIVVCGTSALFDVWINKTKHDVLMLLENEVEFKSLIEKIRLNPEEI